MTRQTDSIRHDPETLLAALQPYATPRQLRLLAVACLRDHWTQLTAPARAAVEVSERFADGAGTVDDLDLVRLAAYQARSDRPLSQYAGDVAKRDAFRAAQGGLGVGENTLADRDRKKKLILDIFGNTPFRSLSRPVADDLTPDQIAYYNNLLPPWVARGGEVTRVGRLSDIYARDFAPVTFHDDWRTECVVQLAAGMYESRDFGRMPHLAELLAEAGCPDAVLDHCRDGGPHVRGCWVIDGLLAVTRP